MGDLNEFNLSESDGGRPIQITATASPGQLLHTGPTDPNSYDKIQLYAANVHDADHTLNIQHGGTDPGDLLPVVLPPNVGLVLDIPLLRLDGRAVPLEMRAYADAAERINVAGWVLRAASMERPGFLDRTAT